MKTPNSTEGELRPRVNTTVQILSELLLYNSALGRGYDAHGMDDMHGWVITSAIHPDAHDRLTESSNAFLASVSERDRELKKRVADMEGEKKGALRIGGAGPLPFRPHTTLEPAETESLSDLKEQAAQLSFPIWGESNPSKTTLVEVLVRSRYGAVTFIDPRGARAGMYSIGRRDFLHDVGCLHLTRARTDDTAFVRSSSTGGANIHSLAGKATSPKFTWLTCPDVRLTKSLGKLIEKKTYAAAARGITLLLPVAPDHSLTMAFPAVALERVFKQVFTLGEHGKTRIDVKWATEELARQWDDISRASLAELFHGYDLSEKVSGLLRKNPARKELIVGAAMRAVITWRILEADSMSTAGVLLAEDMDRLQQFLAAVIFVSSGLSELNDKVERAAEARKARLPTPVEFAHAKSKLAEAITSSEHGMVTRRQALKIEGMTLGILASLAQDELFIEVIGKQNIKMGTAATAYAFREDTTMDAEECADEYVAALQEYDDDDDRYTHINSVAVKLLVDHLQDEAQKNSDNPLVGLPVVQIDTLTRSQIADLPYAVEKLNTTPTQDVFVRGGPERLGMNKEPEYLLLPQDGDPPQLRANVINIWFRSNAKGVSYRNWGLSKLGFPWWAIENEVERFIRREDDFRPLEGGAT